MINIYIQKVKSLKEIRNSPENRRNKKAKYYRTKGSKYFKKEMPGSIDCYRNIKRIGTNKRPFYLRTRREFSEQRGIKVGLERFKIEY